MATTSITRLKLKGFTAFQELDLTFTSGVNVFIGENGTGKTHILKTIYAACDITRTQDSLAEKLVRIFLPHQRRLGRLVHRQQGRASAVIEVFRKGNRLRIKFSSIAMGTKSTRTLGRVLWISRRVECVYIPVKEMLANAPGFRSLYNFREIHFEEIYADIIDRAFRPIPRGPIDLQRKRLLKLIQVALDGKVVTKEEEFFLRNKQGNLEFTLLAEGMRKLALLWLLIQNGTLLSGSILCWDEPETNLNPKLIGVVIEILLDLNRMGVQVFLATHDIVVLKELELRRQKKDKVKYHALYRDPDSKNITCKSTEEYLSLHPNSITDTFLSIYDRDIERTLSVGNE